MSVLLQFEKNIEDAVANFLIQNELSATPSRSTDNLPKDHIIVVFEYGGALEETRQHRAGHLEYNTHQGTVTLGIRTFRTNPERHNERVGKCRFLLMNGNNGLQTTGYKYLDLLPQMSTTEEQEESNSDMTTIQMILKFEIDLKTI